MTDPASPMIRPALAADADAIAAIHTASWRDSYGDIMSAEALGPDLDVRHRAMWQRILGKPLPGRLVLVAMLGDIGGFVVSHPDAEDPGLDFIAALHVTPKQRGRGIGAALMQAWSDRMAAMGRTRATLIVAEENTRARAFYGRLGGVEGPIFEDELDDHTAVPTRHVTWEDLPRMGALARGERLRKAAMPASVTAAEMPARAGAPHPIPAARQAEARRKQRLGDVFGLTDFGVNRVEIDPGTHSTIAHFHSHEDEFVMVLEGTLTLVRDGHETVLCAGDCSGFPAGTGPAHRLENRGDVRAVYLEVGSRRPDVDVTRYPGEDLMVDRGADGAQWFMRLDGTPIARAD